MQMFAGAAVQGRVIWALLLREMLTRYGRANIGFAWLFVEPMLFTLAIVALWSATQIAHVQMESVVAFAVTGYASVLVWRNAASRATNAVETNLGLLFHRNVTVTDLLVSRSFLEIVGGTASFVGLSAVFIFLGKMSMPADVSTILVAWGLLSWFGVALALIVGSAAQQSDAFERIWHATAYILFPLSGAMYMVDWLPQMAQEAALWLPMVHGVEMLRHGYFGAAVVTHESPLYFFACNLSLTLIGLAMAKNADERVEPQ